MRKFLLALAICIAPSLAFAQCSGVFPASSVCGNTSAGANVPGALPLSSFALAPGGVSGNVQTNNGSGGLAGITNTQLTALINQFTSLLSGAVPASAGGAATWLRADGTWTNALIGTSPSGSELAISVLDAGMANTNHLLYKVGIANSTNNVAEWGFGVGSATLNNFWFLGMFGNDCQMKGDGNGFVGINVGCTAVLDKRFAIGSDSNFSVDDSGNEINAGNTVTGGNLNIAGAINSTAVGNFAINHANGQQTLLGGTGGSKEVVFNMTPGAGNPLIYPSSDNAIDLGGSSVRWANAWVLNYRINNLLISATAPTITSGFGGGTPTISAPNGTAAFRVTIGTASGNTGVLGMPTAANGWNCYANDLTTKTAANSHIQQNASGSTASAVAFTSYSDTMGAATWVASDVIAISCFAF